jgi:hypothetical protein
MWIAYGSNSIGFGAIYAQSEMVKKKGNGAKTGAKVDGSGSCGFLSSSVIRAKLLFRLTSPL